MKDLSTLNKIEEGFEVQHESGSIDAENFVSTSGGKLFSTKNHSEKQDMYFEEDESKSEITNAVDTHHQEKKKFRLINIFGPILEEDE